MQDFTDEFPGRQRRRMLRCNRAYVIWSLCSCLGVQLLGMLTIMHWPILRDPLHYSRVNYLLKRQKDSPEAQQVVFLGSSRVQWAIQVRALDAALAGQTS